MHAQHTNYAIVSIILEITVSASHLFNSLQLIWRIILLYDCEKKPHYDAGFRRVWLYDPTPIKETAFMSSHFLPSIKKTIHNANTNYVQVDDLPKNGNMKESTHSPVIPLATTLRPQFVCRTLQKG
jgi:hypothetical protein